MTETEKKALALVNAVCAEWEVSPAFDDDMDGSACFAALTRAIEQHEAFRQEVSDAVEAYQDFLDVNGTSIELAETEARLSRFKIAKPDPLVEAIHEADNNNAGWAKADDYAQHLRAALAARGGRIVWGGE